MTPLIRLVGGAIPPVAALISVTHLVGVEHGPGDGFTAGIISALGITLAYELLGYHEARDRLRGLRFESVLGAGLAIVLLSAMMPLVAGQPFLAESRAGIHVPLLGDVSLSSSLLFDIGIYLGVLGGAMVAIENLRKEDE
jgi:multisubunit Na+/H+ antiporter MnhB subunit